MATGRFADVSDVTTLQFSRRRSARGFFFFTRNEETAAELHALLSQPTRSPYTTGAPRASVVPMWFGDWAGREGERSEAETCLE
ncbi:MAG: hypothetical protein M3M94_05775 [Actinomycetota bacterium]|nr:hypothetical protein [Actinomycetota bacterium]